MRARQLIVLCGLKNSINMIVCPPLRRMTVSASLSKSNYRYPKGFALIATISVMVLLVMVALAMLSLSTIELRSSQNGQAQAEAKANARLALMMAIGQLQKEMGPDRRISATANTLDPGSTSPASKDLHYTGVWNARQELDVSGQLVATPDYDKDDSFRTWLFTSSNDIPKDEVKNADYSSDGALVLGSGSSQDLDDWIYVPKMKSASGHIAWWTSDNGVKQRVNAGHAEDVTDLARLLEGAHGIGGGGTGQHEMDADLPDNADDWQKTYTLRTLALAPSGDSENLKKGGRFHDITTVGNSLPVDVSRGGLRRCLNLAMASNSTTSPDGYTLENEIPWEYFRHYNSLHRLKDSYGKHLVRMESGRPLVKDGSNNDPAGDGNPTKNQKKLRLKPIVVKFMILISQSTKKYEAADTGLSEDRYGLHISFYPVAVVWNPYNVDLEFDSMSMLNQKLPLEFDIRVNGSSIEKFDWREKSATSWISFTRSGAMLQPSGNLGSHATIPAGSNIVLYYNSSVPSPQGQHYLTGLAHKSFDFSPSNPGMTYRNLTRTSREIYREGDYRMDILGKATDKVQILVKADVTDQLTGSYRGQNAWDFGTGSYYMSPSNWGLRSNANFSYKQSTNLLMQSGTSNIDFIGAGEAPQYSFLSLEDNPTPLMLMEFQAKAADENVFPHKHWVHSLPAHLFTSVTRTDWGADLETAWHALPVSLNVRSLSSATEAFSSLNVSAADQNTAYIGPSYGSAEGQLHVTAQALPLAPVHSLGQLQHMPCYDTSEFIQRPVQFGQNHAISNSFASPGLPSDATTHEGWQHWWEMMGTGGGYSLAKKPHTRMDYSYLGNAHLYDSWFCSAIAHQDSSLNVSEGNTRTLRKVAEDFFLNGKQLANPHYTPAPRSKSQATLDSLFNGSNLKPEAYRRLAAHLMVKGGFNVNSTSVEAWKLLLSGLHQREAVVSDSNTGATMRAEKEDGGFIVSRNPISNSGMFDGSANAPEAWTGYRRLDDTEITSLAEEIVRQVKRYGPFRSLGEFVNRRLSYTDKELATMGPLARAIENSTVNENLQAWGEISAGDDAIKKTNYPFPEAAAGPLLQGSPGYITQADILQSLAPIINVRSDSFTIRAYGEATDSQGNVLAKAWCEATVQRHADYIDTSDEAWKDVGDLSSSTNQIFGRRFKIMSFRWLSASEV